MEYGNLKPKGYIPRLIDAQIVQYLSLFGALDIQGMRWCGKSWTAQAFGESITLVDQNLPTLSIDPSYALIGTHPHVIDEWQDLPILWNYIRHSIDDNAGKPGQYILTGSSSPIPQSVQLHNGAGRIAKIKMRTTTLAEQGASSGKVSLSGLFEGKFEPHQTKTSIANLAHLICQGGWPQLLSVQNAQPSLFANQYLQALYTHKESKNNEAQILERMAKSLARNDGTSATITTIQKDVFAGDERASVRENTERYLQQLKLNYFYMELPAWDAPVRSKTRLRRRPKRYIEDSSLVAALLNTSPERLLEDTQHLGLLFENLVVHDLDVYTRLLPDAGIQPLHYFATADGLEVDVVIELQDGRWAALEIKLGASKVESAAASLVRLKEKVLQNPAARNREPEFMAVVLGVSDLAYQRSQDGIYVFPITALTA